MSDSEKSYTRRKFLTDVGRVGGYAALFSTMQGLGLLSSSANARTNGFTPLPPSGRSQGKRVVILGAGIAGLATAYEMNKAGYDTIILEARQRSGGRNWTVRGGDVVVETDGTTQFCQFDRGQYMNMGPARIPQHHVTLDYCRELGVAVEVFTNANAQGYYYNEGAQYGSLASQKVRHRAAKADYFGYTSELLAKATDQGSLDDVLTGDDKEKLLEYLRSFGALTGPGNRYEGSSRRGYKLNQYPGAGNDQGTIKAPPFGLSELLQSEFGRNFSFELSWDQSMLMFQPVGGMDRISDALEQAIRPRTRIVYGAEVQQLTSTENGVSVVYADGSQRPKEMSGDFCVCTIPPQILARIPGLSEDIYPALNSVFPISTGKIGLQYSRRFWEEDEDLMGGITNARVAEDINTIWYPSYGYLEQKGVLIGYYNFVGAADRYAAMSPAMREAEALKAGVKIHGEVYRTLCENSTSISWIKEPYSEGGWVAWPGGRGAAYERLLEPDGQIYFAGDHLSYDIAWQAGAFESARLVVSNIHNRVSVA